MPVLDEDTIYQIDNAPIHTSHETTKWLEIIEIGVIDQPPYSPNLNLIKHLQWALKQKICKLHPKLEGQGGGQVDRDLFIKAAQEAWQALPQDLMKKLINSMLRRIEAVRKARGWQTRY